MKRVSDQGVTMAVKESKWRVEFVDPVTGKTIGKGEAKVEKGRLRVTLPSFSGSVAVKLTRAE
jgi:hypothetical protein